jgi:fumarate reductase flavoprotein subunit
MIGGQAPAKKTVSPKKAIKEHKEKADIVIIGTGAAGFTAAITAHDLGAKVVLLEKQPLTGGNSMLAEGGMNAAGTKLQAAKGVKDSPDLMFKDTMTGGKNINDPVLVHILADNSAASVDWLTSLGADLNDLGELGGASVSRAHRPSGGAAVGAHIIEVLRKNAAQRKIEIRVNTTALRLQEDKTGRVTGVVVQGKHSGQYTIESKAVIITAGGFSANPERVAHYRPEYRGMTTSNQPGATGDGIDMGSAAGAELVDMKEIQIHPTIAAGSRILITEAVRGNGAILINQDGKRFVNEMTTRDAVSAAILAQKGKTAFLIFDDEIRKSLSMIEGYFHLKLVKEGGSIEELATAVNVPTESLKATLATYNKAYEAKNDTEFKRADMARPVMTPKFYAIQVQPGVHYTMGGLKVNCDSMVIDKKGQQIKGLYAAGEGTGGVHGTNRLGGNSISQTITFGRIAGRNAAAAAKQQ